MRARVRQVGEEGERFSAQTKSETERGRKRKMRTGKNHTDVHVHANAQIGGKEGRQRMRDLSICERTSRFIPPKEGHGKQ